MKEPTTTEGYFDDLEKWGCKLMDTGRQWVVRSPKGGETRLEAEDMDSAIFEAWNLMKPTTTPIQYHEDHEIGMTMGETKVVEIHNAHGQHYWKATAPIDSLFGSEVYGECSGIGPTKEAALEALAKDRKNLNDSLWA